MVSPLIWAKVSWKLLKLCYCQAQGNPLLLLNLAKFMNLRDDPEIGLNFVGPPTYLATSFGAEAPKVRAGEG